ncbi:hypothetical protein [Variovorax sp. KK3]|uniref:hypothetical protein n=1 Tax=Variovorax sp. KK3 TaxID=1855728 RepID=UPI003AAE2484
MNNLGNPAPRPSLNSIARPSAGPNSIVDAFNSRWLTNGEGNKKYLIAKRDDGPLNFEESGWTFGAKSGRALSAGDDRKAQYRHAAEALTLLAESAKKENIGLDAAEAILKAVRKSGGQVAIADVQPHINFIVTATQAKNRQVAAAFVDADVTCEGTEPLHLFSLVKKAQNGAAGATPDGADPSPLAKRTNDILALNAAATSLKGLTAQPRFARSPLAAALAGNAVNPRDARSIIDMLADWPGSLELRVRELLAFPADTKAAAKDVALDVAEQKSILRLAHRVLTGDSFLLTIRDPAERERFEGLGVAAGQLLDDLATGPLDRLEKLASGLYHSPAEVRNRLTQVLTEKQAAAPAPPGRAAKVARPHQAPVVAAPRRPSASNPAPAPDQTRATAVAVAPGPEPDDDEFDIDFVQPREPAQQAERLVPRAAWNAFAPSAVEKLMAEFDVDPMEATEWQSRLDPKHFIRWKLEEQQRTDYPSADFSPSATAYQQEWSDHESREQLWLDLGVSSELEKARFMRFSPDNVEQQLAELRTDSTVSTPPNHPPPDPPSGVTQPPSNYMPPTLPSGKDQPAPNDVPPPPNSVVQPPPNYVPPTLPSGKDQPAPNDVPPPPNSVVQPPPNYVPPTLPSGKDQPAPNDVPPPPNSVVQPPPNYVPPTLPSGKDQPAPNDVPPPPNSVVQPPPNYVPPTLPSGKDQPAPNDVPPPPNSVVQPPPNYVPPTLPSGKDQPAPNDVPPPPNSVVQPPPNYVPPTLPSGKDQPAPNDIPPPPNTVIPPRASSVNPSPLRDIPPPMRSALRFDSESLSKELLQHNTYLTLSKSGSGPQVEYNGRAYYFAVKQSPRFGWIVGRQREKAERALQAVIRESNIDPRDRKAESAKLAIPQKDVDKVWRSYREDVLTILKADAGTRRHDAYLRERRVKLALKEFSELPAQPPNAQQAVQGYVAVDGGDLANAVPNYFDRVAAASNKRLADSKGIENEDPFVGRLVEALGASGVLNKQTAEGKFGDFKQMTEDFLAAPRTADALGPRPRGLTPEVLFALIPSGMLIKLPSAVGNIFERAGCKAESRDEIGKNPAVKVENVKLATKEYLDTFNTQIDRLQYVGELLTNPDYIALFPSDAQAAIRTLGEEMQEITIKMLDPQGPYISMYRLAQSAQTDPAGVTKQLQESVWVMSPKKTT